MSVLELEQETNTEELPTGWVESLSLSQARKDLLSPCSTKVSIFTENPTAPN